MFDDMDNNDLNREHSLNRKLYLLILVISFIAFIFSIIILAEKTSYAPAVNNFCSALSPQSRCEAVQKSVYGKTFGIDNPYFGIVGFIILMILSFKEFLNKNKVSNVRNIRNFFIISGSIIAGFVALWFVYVQKFLLNIFCILCVVVDVSSLILMIIAIILCISVSSVRIPVKKITKKSIH